jgi:hypothetical protein
MDYEIFELGDVTLQSGMTLRNAQLAYKTYGTLNAIFCPIPSIWGHFAGGGVNPADTKFIDDALKELLGT